MERDDLIVNDSYALNAHHSEEDGKKIRKKIMFVTVLLTVITAIEVAMGIYFKQDDAIWTSVKWAFIIMTIVKAGYIVLVFMHLGDERKNLRNTILVPYLVFIGYLIWIAFTEGAGHLENFTNHH